MLALRTAALLAVLVVWAAALPFSPARAAEPFEIASGPAAEAAPQVPPAEGTGGAPAPPPANEAPPEAPENPPGGQSLIVGVGLAIGDFDRHRDTPLAGNLPADALFTEMALVPVLTYRAPETTLAEHTFQPHPAMQALQLRVGYTVLAGVSSFDFRDLGLACCAVGGQAAGEYAYAVALGYVSMGPPGRRPARFGLGLGPALMRLHGVIRYSTGEQDDLGQGGTRLMPAWTGLVEIPIGERLVFAIQGLGIDGRIGNARVSAGHDTLSLGWRVDL
jgi:hypothetical protein